VVDHQLSLKNEQKRHGIESRLQDRAQYVLEQARGKNQGLHVRRKGLQGFQLQEAQFDLQSVLREHAPGNANEQSRLESLEQAGRRISRLGPLTFAAIEEYKQQSERKIT